MVLPSSLHQQLRYANAVPFDFGFAVEHLKSLIKSAMDAAATADHTAIMCIRSHISSNNQI